MSAGGYVKLWRSIMAKGFWTREPFTMGQAWADLIMLANYAPTRILRGSRWLDVGRGQVLTSMMYLSSRWKRDRKTVRAWLLAFASDSMLDIASDSGAAGGYTLLTLRNYEKFQGAPDDDSPADSPPEWTAEGTADSPSHSPAHSPAVSPQSKKEKKFKKVKKEAIGADAPDALAWLNLLNEEAGTAFRATEANLRPIRARIREGHTPDDATKVVTFKVRQWANTEEAQYLRPCTVFGPKFDGYLQAARNGHSQTPHKPTRNPNHTLNCECPQCGRAARESGSAQ